MAMLQELHQQLHQLHQQFQHLHQEQLELANVLEVTKRDLKKQGFAIKKMINEEIMGLVRYLCIFLTCIVMLSRGGGESSNLLPLRLAVYFWFGFLCRCAYRRIYLEIESMDGLLERDEMIKRNVDRLARIFRDTYNLYQVTSQFIGGPVVAVDVRVFAHIVDRGACISQVALLQQLVEEPSVSWSYRFTYHLLVLALPSFAILFVIFLTYTPNYALEGNAHLSREYLNFELLSPT